MSRLWEAAVRGRGKEGRGNGQWWKSPKQELCASLLLGLLGREDLREPKRRERAQGGSDSAFNQCKCMRAQSESGFFPTSCWRPWIENNLFNSAGHPPFSIGHSGTGLYACLFSKAKQKQAGSWGWLQPTQDGGAGGMRSKHWQHPSALGMLRGGLG